MPTAPHFQCHPLPAELFPSYFPTCSFTLLLILCLGSRLVCFATQSGSENQAPTGRTPCKMKTPPAKNFFRCMSGMSLCPTFRHRLRSLWHQFFGTIALMEFVLKNPCQQRCYLVSIPANEAIMHVPWPKVWKLWQVLGGALPKLFPQRFSSVHHVHTSVSLPLPKLFPAVSRPSTMSTLPSRSLFPSYFPRFPVRPPCPRFPELFPTRLPSVHPVVASVSLPPIGALPKLFPTVSRPSTLSSLLCRSPCGKVNQTRTQASEMLLGKKVEGPMLKGNSISNVLNLPCVQGYPTTELKPQIIQNI